MSADPCILVLHGPNLNLLGTREPHYYGHHTLEELNAGLMSLGRTLFAQAASGSEMDAMRIECRQTNAEHELVNWVQQAPEEGVRFIVLNPAAFTHTSVAVRDALTAVGIPFIEVHLSNVYGRESFRRHSYFSDMAIGVISGLGVRGYEYALREAAAYLHAQAASSPQQEKREWI